MENMFASSCFHVRIHCTPVCVCALLAVNVRWQTAQEPAVNQTAGPAKQVINTHVMRVRVL